MASADDVSDDDIGDAIDILLVEPNPGDTRLFTENFRDAKLVNAIHTVSDGTAALDFVHQRGDYEDAPEPELVILEPQLPETTGMEVLSELKDDPSLCELPVIVLTSSGLGKEIVKSHDLEADEYIRKPVEIEEFIGFVQDVEDFWFAIVRTENDE